MNNHKTANRIISDIINRRKRLAGAAGLIFAALVLIFLPGQINAQQPVQTSIVLPRYTINASLVTVFDAGTGRQVSNGRTTVQPYVFTNKYIFTSDPGKEFVIVVLSDQGKVASARAIAGDNLKISLVQDVASLPVTALDGYRNAILAFENDPTNPESDAQVTVVESTTFSFARQGMTNHKGRYYFDSPDDLQASEGFLAVEWKGSGPIRLGLIQ